jgi:hypothetical protein
MLVSCPVQYSVSQQQNREREREREREIDREIEQMAERGGFSENRQPKHLT